VGRHGGQTGGDIFGVGERDGRERLEALGTARPRDWPAVAVPLDDDVCGEQALAVPRGRPLAARYLNNFIDELKASGFVAAALEKSGQRDAAVAP